MFFNCNWCKRTCCCDKRYEKDCKRPEKNYCDINNRYDYDEGDECRDNRYDKCCRHEHNCFKIKCEKICCLKPQNNQNDYSHGNEYDFGNQGHYCRCNNLGNFNQNNYRDNINENPTGLYYYNKNNFNNLNY